MSRIGATRGDGALACSHNAPLALTKPAAKWTIVRAIFGPRGNSPASLRTW
jgi:hypothetical protein